MGITWCDVSLPLHAGMTVWPGDPVFEITPCARMDAGDSCNVSQLRLGTHTGTHIDAPWHFDNTGKRLQQLDTALFFGDALLITCPEVDIIHASDLPATPLPPRILIQTKNAQLPPDAPFQEDFVALAEDAAQYLVEAGVRLVGIDYLSIAPKGQSGPTHRCLLENEVLIIEGLRLGGFSPGIYPFIALPLPLQDADGAPCRAFLGTPKRQGS